MARITVPFSGLTSNANHKDGECSNLVNLRPKNGYLKPVPPRKISHTLSQEYKIIFIHRIGEVENWVGVTKDGKNIYAKINTDSPVNIDLSINTPFFAVIQGIQQIGNTLTLLTDEGLRYLLWADGVYTYLGAIPDLPVVSFNTPAMELKSLKYTTEYDASPSFASDKISELYDYTRGLANVLIDRNKGKFCDAFSITYAFRLYDGSAIKHSSPMLVMPRESYKDWAIAYLPRPSSGDLYGADAEVRLKMFMLNAVYNFSSLSLWKDVIKSVDFFVTKYVGLASPENLAAGFWSRMISAGRGEPPTYLHNMYYPGGRSDSIDFKESVEDKVISTSQFYLYYSEDDFSGPKTNTFPNNKVTVKDNFYNIIHQEEMPADSFSHHELIAIKGTTYNNRLRLSGITTKLFQGFTPNYFAWGSQYNGEISQNLSGFHWLHTVVHIKTDEGVKIVRGVIPVINPILLSAFVSYPDPRATKICFYVSDFNESFYYERLVVNLSAHPSLNIAYAINTGLLPFVFNTSVSSVIPYVRLDTNTIEPNKLKVSEINNPFVFPNLNTYQIGSGKILNESSIIMNVSDRNYGMYPVFVFTDNGVFTMAGQAADTVHDSVQAPTYLEPPISDKICATPYGVVFITKRGLMMISQHETKFLSPQLRDDGDNVIFRLPGTDDDPVVDLQDKIYPADSITFRDFLSSVSDMIYNPYNDELIISSKENEYCYVYDFPTSSYYISTENITGVVQNSFPDIYVLDGKNVKDYSQKHNGTTNISVITRPLHFGTSDIKTLERTILRALLYKVHSITVIAFHSVDGVRFEPAKGRLVEGDDKNYKDIDLGLLARETYPHYVLLISGTIDDESQIKYAEFEVSKRYDNDKMR